MHDSGFTRIPATVDFPSAELEILDLWDTIDAFARQVSLRPAEREYVFYDGPPFANGKPHYGHMLAGVIKDVVPRYWSMRGYRVERRFGWDTHGLPIEMEVEKLLQISGPRQIHEYGIGRFNEACRALAEDSAEEWAHLVRRVGRWVDMEDDYKTMDPDYMESVWWVFGQLWKRDLIYRDFKVLPYSVGATTPLSNFEANMDYRDVDDPSITVSLEVIEGRGPVETGDNLLIWTTTPWTLPGHLAVAVGEGITYAAVRVDQKQYWLAEARVGAYWPDAVVEQTVKGEELVGITYHPPFDYFGEERDRGAFRVIGADHVTVEDGTGLVHEAPAYGEADFFALQAAGLDVLVDPVDAEGRFTDAVPEVAGLNIKDADKVLIKMLKERDILVRSERINHSYPFCYRTGTPLIYKAIPTWFVKVEQQQARMVEHNSKIHWVPKNIGERRFGNWLAGARDWAISRNRYWGSCIPVWECSTCRTFEAIGSLDDLEARSGQRPSDLHKHVIDPITWPCDQEGCSGIMTRVPEVLDCWFESGSMPYAQLHYPFENQARFDATFPAEFIAEGLDQTRGWFYTLHVLATAIFDAPAFKNCVVNGMILADDGRKMSKSLHNYPDPNQIFDEFGADALRAFLINSPVLRAEPLRFSEDGVREVVRTVMLPLWNTYSFFTTYAEADGLTMTDIDSAPPPDERPETDRWILSVLQSLVAEVNTKMEGYYLYDVVPPTIGFIDDLTNWYVRRSRRRFWRTKTADDADKLAAFATLYEVLVTFSKVLAPVLPFITEKLYQGLVVDRGIEAPDSVHHCDFPQAVSELIDADLEDAMQVVRRVVTAGRALRSRQAIGIRQPLSKLTVLTRSSIATRAVETHITLISDELNVKEVVTSSDEGALVVLSAKANFKTLGPRFGAEVRAMDAAISTLDSSTLEALVEGGTIQVAGHVLEAADVVISRVPREGVIVGTDGELSVALDVILNDRLVSEGLARDVVSKVQALRRDAGLDVSDRISLVWWTDDSDLAGAIADFGAVIAAETLSLSIQQNPDAPTDERIGDRRIKLGVERVT